MAGLPGAQGPPGFKVRHLLIDLAAFHPFNLGTNCRDIDYNADMGTRVLASVKMESMALTFLRGPCPKLEPDLQESLSRQLEIPGPTRPLKQATGY